MRVAGVLMIGSRSSVDFPRYPGTAGGSVLVASPAERGFTLVELVVTMIIVGILALSAIPRMMGRAGFDTRGFHDELITAIQFARQEAVAQRRQICVTVAAAAAGPIRITRALAPAPGVCGATPLLNPTTGAAYDDVNSGIRLPTGVVIAGVGATALPLTINFDALGQPQLNATAVLSITGDGVRCVAVEAGTGYVRGYLAPC